MYTKLFKGGRQTSHMVNVFGSFCQLPRLAVVDSKHFMSVDRVISFQRISLFMTGDSSLARSHLGLEFFARPDQCSQSGDPMADGGESSDSWDDVLGGQSEVAAAAAADDALHELVPLPQAVAKLSPKRPCKPKSRWRVAIPAPKRRTQVQGVLAASRMRDHRSLKRRVTTALEFKRAVERAFDALRDVGLLNDRGRSAVRMRHNKITILTGRTAAKHVPFQTMLAMSFSDVQRRADVARAFQLDVQTATRIRCLIANAAMSSDAQFASQLGKYLESPDSKTESFVSSLAADATSERLFLPMLGLEESPGVGKSAWHVLVSNQRFAWARGGAWHFIEMVRPNIALVSTETAQALLQGLYGVPQTRQFVELELAGLKAATYPFLHFDLDGHSANANLSAFRRQAIIDSIGKTPLTSCKHCGNHAQNLIDNCFIDCFATKCVAWMAVGSKLFHMGGNFLRMIHAVPGFVDKHLPVPTLGAPGCVWYLCRFSQQ